MRIFRFFLPILFFGGLLTSSNSEAVDFSAYGFLKAGVVAGSRSVESFGNANLSAPVRVFPSNNSGYTDARSSFQLSQSRLGIHINRSSNISGQIEVDFIDFEKASPVVKALPRLRVAQVRYSPSPQNTFSIGQDWDVFSPTKPHTFNFVGLYFGAGNAGFIRPQVKWSHFQDKATLETALGLPGLNATATDGDLERGLIPSVSAMLSYAHQEGGRIGISAIAGRLKFSSGGSEMQSFYGVNAFYEQPITSQSELHSEIYYGENLANIGALTLALGTFGESRHEWGGYLTLKVGLVQDLMGQIGCGYARVTESNGSVLKGITDYRVLDNLRAAGALSYRLGGSLDLFFEIAALRTGFLETATAQNIARTAAVVDSGAVYWF